MLGALIVANLKMLVRNRQSLFWAVAFPLIFVVVFGLFRVGDPTTSSVGVVDNAQDTFSRELVEQLRQVDQFEVQEIADLELAKEALEDGDLDNILVIPQGLAGSVGDGDPVELTLVFEEGDPTSLSGIGVMDRFLDQVNLRLAEAPALLEVRPEGLLSNPVDYFDFLLLGLVGMGVMTFSVIGIATVMALYKEKKILKRIQATPLPVSTFFAGMVIAYLVVSLGQTAIILGAGILLFDATIYGNYLYIGLLVVMGNLIFLSLGFIVGAVAKNVQAASGLGNAVALPMMFLSGTFFPTDDLPVALSTVVQYLPLSPLLEAIRGVALDAKPFWEFPRELALLGGWIVGSSLVAVRIFRFS
jgi:ABC-2 type transport system permease protein